MNPKRPVYSIPPHTSFKRSWERGRRTPEQALTTYGSIMETEKIPGREQESMSRPEAGRHPSELVRISRERHCPKDLKWTGDRFRAAAPPPPLKPIHGSKTTGLAKMPRSLPGVTRYSTRAHTPHPLHSKLRCLSKYPARKAPPHELRRSERSVITGGSRATFYIILVSQVWGLNRLKADRRPQMHSHPRGLPLIVARKRTYKGHE